ncbi:hypothetical protein C9374_008022 [Naegleria lovaniensis]|uniref:RGS domain-containing protein n=1 Tax=Naegleria lovaniensis TaxID=51637 RepID=A0AA88GJX2_NAELO|nr:uncharacterized protein C9374_008022 [Naegleria lovaniensis]KAG2378874.1 hypothetical protein C9374_008022 [Naegleria lovaniensis]
MPTLASYFTSVDSDSDHLDLIPSSRIRANNNRKYPSPRGMTTTSTQPQFVANDSPSGSPPPSPSSSQNSSHSLSISERSRSKSCSGSPNLSPDSTATSRRSSKSSNSGTSSNGGFMPIVHSPGVQLVYGNNIENGSVPTTINSLSSSLSSSPRIMVDSYEKTIKEIIKCYQFNFEKFITSGPEFVESFKEYLNLECNLAPFEFCEKVTEFKLLSLPQDRTDMAHSIIETYVKMASDKEINISSNIREVICSEFKSNQSNGEVPLSLFDRALAEVQFSLKNDTFQRYVTSNDFVKFIMHHIQHHSSNSPTTLNHNTTLTSTTIRRISTCSEDEDAFDTNTIHNFCSSIGTLSPTPRGRTVSCAQQLITIQVEPTHSH